MSVIRIKPEAKEVLKIEHDKTELSETVLATRAILNFYKPKKKKGVHPSFTPMKQLFQDYWRLNNGFDHTSWGPADASALNRIIRQLEIKNEKQAPLNEFWEAILKHLPEFYKNKSLNAINKNLDGIIAEIKNGRKQTAKVSDGGKFDFRN